VTIILFALWGCLCFALGCAFGAIASYFMDAGKFAWHAARWMRQEACLDLRELRDEVRKWKVARNG
jgi:hypothetical protein